MANERHHVAHNTQHECDFINLLGEFSQRGLEQPRGELLKGYYSAALRRERWGEIDRDVVMTHIANAIAAEDSKSKSRQRVV